MAAKTRAGPVTNAGTDSGTKSHPTSFWLDEETKATLERLMEERGISRSEVVREALRRMGEDKSRNEIRRLVDELDRIV